MPALSNTSESANSKKGELEFLLLVGQQLVFPVGHTPLDSRRFLAFRVSGIKCGGNCPRSAPSR